jgi:putative chitinase
MINLYNNGGFHWWIGVVEDRNDPLFLGRCRVRIMGYHNQSKTELPTADLPWAYPLQPITSAAMTGIGQAPVGPVEGTTVMGFFQDGDDCQEPVMMGTFGGIPQDDYYRKLPADAGFVDPNKKYPLQELRNEPDTNRLARGQGLTNTLVGKKKSAREQKVPVANGGQSWDQPTIPYAARYPFNHVTSTESGHVVEFDDTPGAERVQVYHMKGSFVEIDKDGTMVRRIVGDDFQILERNGHIVVKGGLSVTVMGDAKILVQNDCDLEVNGSMHAKVHQDFDLNVAGKMKIVVGDSLDIRAKDINLTGEGSINVNADIDLNLFGQSKAALGSKAFVVVGGASLQLMPLTPPTAGRANTPNPTNKLNPRRVDLPDLGFGVTVDERQALEAEKIAALENPSPTSDDYIMLKQMELDSGEKVSTSTPTTVDELIPQTDCPIGLQIIEAAKKDVGIIETGTLSRDGDGLNYGGAPGGGELPKGVPGRIDEMMRSAGLDNQSKVLQTGSGYYWCMGAVIDWWKQAGIMAPKIAKVSDFAAWAKANGLYAPVPCPGAAVLYGPEGRECHTGIVAMINDDGSVITIEGNTSGGGYNANGCGCFIKQANMGRISGYVIPPGCGPSLPPTTPTIPDDMTAAIENLKGIVPQKVLDELPLVISKFAINTPLRLAHFLSQCQHESLDFTRASENLSYTEANLKTIFGKYFPGQLASEYAKQPERIGSRVYANRNGNGDEASGDGYKYRGRGYIQLTGKSNYAAFGKFVSVDILNNPDLVETKYPLLSAAWFWVKSKNLNPTADRGSDVVTITAVTKAVNGGTNGLADRIQNFNDVYGRLA